MRCKCGGDMMHTKSSKQAPPSYVKVHNWVRPSLEQTMSLSESMRNHILNGGLILEDELKWSDKMKEITIGDKPLMLMF